MSNNKVLSGLGIYVYGLASAIAGLFDFIWGDFDASHQPIQALGDNIPGVKIFAYITAFWMVAGGVAILWRRSARAGAAALAGIYLIFAMFWLPRFYTAPHYLGMRIPVYIGVFTGMGTQLIVCAAGALVYASLAMGGYLWPRTVLAVRWIFGVCSIAFGLGHLTNVHDNIVYVPKWIPLGQEFWVIVTGTCFVLAGIAILTGILDALAAWLLGLQFLAFNLLILPSFILADPHDHAAWGGSAYNLAAVGAAWILADQLARSKPGRQDRESS
jgi:uncharacterized membrane protein